MHYKRKNLFTIILAVVFLILTLFNFACASEKDNHLYRNRSEDFSVHYLNVGQGDCIFMQFPDGKNMLIDCGEKDENLSEFIVKFIKGLEVNSIDYFVLTHPNSDHIGNAIDIIENFAVKTIFTPDIIEEQLYFFPLYSSILQAIEENKITKRVSHYYTSIKGDNYSLGFLSPSPKSISTSSYYDFNNSFAPTSTQINAMSPIIYLQVFGRKFLFTGDTTTSQEQLVIENYLLKNYNHLLSMQVNLENIDFLKVAHHGGEGSSSTDFLNLIKPNNAIISVSGANFYGHPSDIVLERLQRINEDISIYRTDYDGTISVLVDKQGQIEIITDKILNEK